MAGILRALANERRLMILCKLVEWGEGNVNSLAEAVGLSQSALSQHLAKMRDEGLVDLPARKPDALVSHRRPADRRPLRHPAQALLQASQTTLNHGVSHVTSQDKPGQGQAICWIKARSWSTSARRTSMPARRSSAPGICRYPSWTRPTSRCTKAGPSSFIARAARGRWTMPPGSRGKPAVPAKAFIVEGGLDAWKKAGLPVVTDRRQPIELQRQVQIGAGSLAFIGTMLGCNRLAVVLRGAGVCRRRIDDGRRDRLLRDGPAAHAGAVEQGRLRATGARQGRLGAAPAGGLEQSRWC